MYRYITAIDFKCIPLYALDTVFLYMPVQNVPGTKTLCVKFSRLFCLRDRRYFHHSGHRLAEERIIEQSDDTRREFHKSYKMFTLHFTCSVTSLKVLLHVLTFSPLFRRTIMFVDRVIRNCRRRPFTAWTKRKSQLIIIPNDCHY